MIRTITRRDLFGRGAALLPAVGLVSASGLIGMAADASPAARLDVVTAELQALIEPRMGAAHRWVALIGAERGGAAFVKVESYVRHYERETDDLPAPRISHRGLDLTLEREVILHWPPVVTL